MPQIVEEMVRVILKNLHKNVLCICINDKFSCATCYIKLQYVRIWVAYYLVYLNIGIKNYSRYLLYFILCKYLAFKMVLILWKMLCNRYRNNVFIIKICICLYGCLSHVCKTVSKFLFTNIPFNRYYLLLPISEHIVLLRV